MAGIVPISRNESSARLVNEAIHKTYRIGQVDRFLFSRAMRELDALQKVDVVDAECHRALLLGVAGRFEEAEAALLNAERNNGFWLADEARMKVALNRMRFSDAAKIAVRLLQDPGPLPLSTLISVSCGCGMFRASAQTIDTSIREQRVIQATDIVPLAQRAARALDEAGVSDEVIVRTLDELGAIANRESLLWMNDYPDISVLLANEGGPLVRMSFRVDLSPEEASEMNWELVDRLVDLDIALSGFSVGLIGQPVTKEQAAVHS